MTVIIYLNEGFEKGETTFFPGIDRWIALFLEFQLTN